MITNKAYYPAHGVVDIQGQKIIPNVGVFYILKTSNQITILAKNTAFRPLISKEQGHKVLEFLKEVPTIAPNTIWTKQYRDSYSKIISLDIMQVVSVYRDLKHLQTIKELSFGARTMLMALQELIFSELTAIGVNYVN